jgi:hypothetical protein
MGRIPPVNEILQNRQDIWDAVTIVYPACKQGLEIECGDGYKLKVGRKRGQNLWGISSQDYPAEWSKNNVNSFCRQMKPTEIDYKKDSFDVVINNNDIDIQNKQDARKILKHIKRICSTRAYLNLPLDKKFSKSWWLKTIIDIGFVVECLQETTSKTLVLELQC